MKNPFLSHLSFFDRIYPVIRRLPTFLRKQIAYAICAYLHASLEKRNLPDRLTIFVTNRCNLNCRHCFIPPAERQESLEMGLREYEIFFRKAKGVFSQVLFTGGEPVLRDDLGDIIIFASKYGAVSSGTIFTNGTLCNRLITCVKQVINRSSMHLNFQVSLDGTEIFHDANRGMQGAFRKIEETMFCLRELKARYPKRLNRLVVATAISKGNISQLPRIIGLVKKQGFSQVFTFVRSSKHHVFNLADSQDISDFSPLAFNDYLIAQEMQEALIVIDEHLWSRQPPSLLYATNRVILKTIAESMESRIPKTACYSGLADLVLLPNGDIGRCEMLRPFANLKDFDWDIKRLKLSSLAKEYYRRTRGCWCTHDCSIGLSIMYDAKLLSELFG